MGFLTFQEIREEVMAYHTDRSDLTATRVNRAINLAQYRIARRHDWDDLKYTILGTLSVSPGDTAQDRRTDRLIDMSTLLTGGFRFKNLYTFKLREPGTGRSEKLRGLVHKDFDARFPDPDFHSRSMPLAYTWFGTRVSSGAEVKKNMLEIVPAPDVAYQYELRVTVQPRILGDGLVDGDPLDFNSHDDAVINLAVSIIYQSFGREDKALEYFKIYSVLVQELIDADDRNPHSEIIGQPVPGGVSGQYWRDPFVRSNP